MENVKKKEEKGFFKRSLVFPKRVKVALFSAITLLIVATLTAVGFSACGVPDKKQDIQINNEDGVLELSQYEIVLEPYDAFELKALNVQNANKVVWESSDESIATVKGGTVKAQNVEGEATIVAKYGNTEKQCKVTVYDGTLKSYIAVSGENFVIALGEDFLVEANVIFQNEIKEDATQKISWRSSDPSVVEIVSVDNGQATVKGNTVGETELIAYVEDRDALITKTVTVQVKSVSDGKFVSIMNADAGVQGYYKDIPLVQDGEKSTSFVPSVKVNYTEDVEDIVWQSSDATIATVTSSGIIEAKAEGTTVITGSFEVDGSAREIKLTITAYKPVFALDEGKTLTVETKLNSASLAGFTTLSAMQGTIENAWYKGSSVFASYDSGVVKFKNFPTVASDLGNSTVTFETDKAFYEVPAFVCTKVIENKNDLSGMFCDGVVGHDIDGLFVLYKDLDLGGVAIGKQQTLGWSSYFKGTFDGRGHTIRNFVTGVGGLFGRFCGVIKNVNFAQVGLGKADNSTLIASIIQNYAIVKDIDIEITAVSNNSKSCIIGGQYTVQMQCANVTIHADGLTVSNAFGFAQTANQATNKFENVKIYCQNVVAYYYDDPTNFTGNPTTARPSGVVWVEA